MTAVRLAQDKIREAKHLLITAGAGLSAAAGFDYADRGRFKELFPAFAAKGLSARYQAIGYRGWTPPEHWGYWATHVHDIRFGPREDRVYRDLLHLSSGLDTFVMTSNVDCLFPRNGFDESKFFSPQGNYGYLQCARACRQQVWDSEPVVRRILDSLDPATQCVTDAGSIPQCPWCGGDVFFNVRLDRHFVEAPYREQFSRLQTWLDSLTSAPLVVLEVGAGFNTPAVIRWPGEQLVADLPSATLIRVNPLHPNVPPALGSRGISIAEDAAQFVSQLLHALA